MERVGQKVIVDDGEGLGEDALPKAPCRWRFEGWDLAPEDFDVTKAMEIRDEEGNIIVHDYSNANNPPLLVEMAAHIQTDHFQIKGKSLSVEEP